MITFEEDQLLDLGARDIADAASPEVWAKLSEANREAKRFSILLALGAVALLLMMAGLLHSIGVDWGELESLAGILFCLLIITCWAAVTWYIYASSQSAGPNSDLVENLTHSLRSVKAALGFVIIMIVLCISIFFAGIAWS